MGGGGNATQYVWNFSVYMAQSRYSGLAQLVWTGRRFLPVHTNMGLPQPALTLEAGGGLRQRGMQE